MKKQTAKKKSVPAADLKPNLVPLGIVGSKEKIEGLKNFLNHIFYVGVTIEGTMLFLEQEIDTPYSDEVVEHLKQVVRDVEHLDFLIGFNF